MSFPVRDQTFWRAMSLPFAHHLGQGQVNTSLVDPCCVKSGVTAWETRAILSPGMEPDLGKVLLTKDPRFEVNTVDRNKMKET